MARAKHQAAGAPVAGRASGPEMARLIREVLDTLAKAERDRVLRDASDPNRRDWHYVPRQRAGLALRDMGAVVRARVDALLRFSLSESGYAKARGIMALEAPLGRIEGRERFRDPLNYSLTVFGTPGRGAWGWRLEGHHLSLNFNARDERIEGVTPAFFGAHPARVADNQPEAGHRVLGHETDLAFALVRSLNQAELERARIMNAAPGNVLSIPGRETVLAGRFEGLPLEAMEPSTRDLACRLLDTYVGALRADLAASAKRRLHEAGAGALLFAWGGPLDGRSAHYWRLHGPVTLIEYDNTQNDANHIHSVWHDLVANFGDDPLRDHYEHGHRHDHRPN